MQVILYFILLLSSLAALCQGEHWALLVAGSNGYSNYRHQADICHSYHVMRNHGIPDEHIIVMMYDDIAHNDENPVQGEIINHPNGPNVYKGVNIDYSGADVNPTTFVNVLTGDEKGLMESLGKKGKVIQSGPNDRIFVNFADHGAPGLLAFPDEVLHAKTLHKAIKSMHKDKKYKQMVFYVEACESGSMFDNILESNISVYVTTAANPDESSYACYYDEKRDTYLGDVYSVKWMEDSDRENLTMETLNSQFKLVKQEVTKSHVMRYGDLSMGSLRLAEFQGNSNLNSLVWRPMSKAPLDQVPSEDVAMWILKHKLARAQGDEAIRHNASLNALMKNKHASEEFFKNLVSLATGSSLGRYNFYLKQPLQMRQFDCYGESIELIQKMCPGMKLTQNDYALRKLRVLANMCEGRDIPDAKIFAAIGKISYESSLC